MPDDDAQSLAALLTRTTQSVHLAQQELDAPLSPEEERSGLRYFLTSIPVADLRLRFGVTTRKDDRFLFIPRGTSTSRLRHTVAIRLVASHAAPAPVAPAPQSVAEATFTLREPPFLLDAQEEERVIERLRQRLANPGGWRDEIPDGRIDAEDLSKALDQMEEMDAEGAVASGRIVFRVAEAPDAFVIVYVGNDAADDMVFAVTSDEFAVRIFSLAGDREKKLRYEPLHRLTVAFARWLSGQGPAARVVDGEVPQRWGFSALGQFALQLWTGYAESVQFLAAQAVSVSSFDIESLQAEVSFAVRYDEQTVDMRVDEEGEAELIEGRVRIDLSRQGNTIVPTITLVSPGYVLGQEARNAIVAEIQREHVDELLDALDDDAVPEAAYRSWIASPPGAGVVIMLSAKKPGAEFRFVVTWPAIHAGEERHFVFLCTQQDGRLAAFDRVMNVGDTLNQPLVTASGDAYEQFHRVFRAMRIWRSGIARA